MIIVIVVVVVFVIICNESIHNLPWVGLIWFDLTSIAIVIIGMTLYELALHYHLISSFLLYFLLICSPLHSILLYFKLIQLNSIRFCWIAFDFVSICPSVCPSAVCLSVCLSVWISFCFLFSSLSYRFSILSLFFFWWLFSFMNIFLAHSHAHAHTRILTCIWIYVPSYDSYILLQKSVSEESYSSDCIISYLI